MASAQEWEIKKRGDTCSAKQQPFADHEPIVSRLLFGEGGYVREDFSAEAWTDEMGEGAVSVWRGVFQLPPPPPDDPLKKETAESLLRELIKKDDYSRKNPIYILAVMLERRRILVEKEVQQKDDGTLVRIYEHRKSGEVFIIPDPDLKLAELQHVQEEVLDLLGIKKPGESDAEQEASPEAEAQVENA